MAEAMNGHAATNDHAEVEDHDIIILGAGLSGINTAHVLRSKLPHRSYTILEKRPVLGGTWNFFRYPGFRSDSNMLSFGLTWYPWTKNHSMGQGHEILQYLNDAVDADGTRELIRFRHKVVDFEWRSDEQKFRLEVDVDGTIKIFKANFIVSCLGYYADDKALDHKIPGLKDFGGQVVHTQWWPEDLDYAGKRVVLIGSGATAITVVPALAEKVSHLTMLQRSPSYVLSVPLEPTLDRFLKRIFPTNWVLWFLRWTEMIFEFFFTEFLLKFPAVGRWGLMKLTKPELPDKVDLDVHFNPSYGPFEQRLCFCPNSDFFKALHQDNCDIVTDTIETVTKDGIQLTSGKKLNADIIITATGLYFQLFDGIKPKVDGKPLNLADHYCWRGSMLEGLPNTAFIFGHTTSSWTPGANIQAHLVTKLLKHMEKKGAATVVPQIDRSKPLPQHLAVDAKSNYFVKAADRMPKATGEGPWYGRKNLFWDFWAYWISSMDEGMVYGGSKDKDA